MGVFGVAFEDHEFLVVEDEVRSFVEGGEDVKGIVEFFAETGRDGIASGSRGAKFDKAEDLLRQGIADPGDGSDRTAVDKAVKDLRVDADHEGEIGIAARDVFGGVAERFGSAEFFETDEVGVILPEVKKEIGFRFKSVVGAVVDHCREISSGIENVGEVSALRGRRRSPGHDAGNDHETGGPDFTGVGGMSGGEARILCAGSDDDGDSAFDESGDARLPLGVRQERPVSHGAAVDDSTHAGFDETACGPDEGGKVRLPGGIAGSHESRDAALKDIGFGR